MRNKIRGGKSDNRAWWEIGKRKEIEKEKEKHPY